jgi:hypothetical protein
MDSTSNNSQEVSVCTNAPLSLTTGVKERKDKLLKERLRTLIRQTGLTERYFYQSLGMTRQYWYGVSWGLLITPYDLKLKIASALKTDTSIIWVEVKA